MIPRIWVFCGVALEIIGFQHKNAIVFWTGIIFVIIGLFMRRYWK